MFTRKPQHALAAAIGGLALVAAVAAGGALALSGNETITTIAGGARGPMRTIGDGGPATAALLYFPDGVARDKQGNLYIADTHNNRVRKVSPDGTITTFAGGGTAFPGDGGAATSARLAFPQGVAVDARGNVYITDQQTNRVRKVSADGKITTFAGRAASSALDIGDGGPATSALVQGPTGVAVDGQGNVYIAEDHRVRKVNPAGTITTIAGGRNRGFTGDGGPATSAELFWPSGLAVDKQGNLYIWDTNNKRIRKVSPNGTITTVAGTGTAGFSGDGGPATSAQLGGTVGGALQGLAVDGQGDLYIADGANDRVRKVSPGGTITTIAGSTTNGVCSGISFGGDGGPAVSAKLNCPTGVAVDGQGNLYIADRANNRVRKVGGSTSAATAAPKLTLGAASPQRLLDQQAITVTARCGKACSLTATGSVTIVGTRSVFGLTPARASLAAAGAARLTLRFTAAAQKRFRQRLKRGQRAQATITVKATDKARHTRTLKRTVAVQSATAAGAPTVSHAARGVSGPCSKTTAAMVMTDAKIGIDIVTGKTPIQQVLCGPFLGPGSSGMVASIAIPSCGFSIGWAVFRFDGSDWQLVLRQDHGASLAKVGSNIRETQGVLRPGDAHCFPSAQRSRIWHWSGKRLVSGAWKVISAGPKTVHLKSFLSPDGKVGSPSIRRRTRWSGAPPIRLGRMCTTPICTGAARSRSATAPPPTSASRTRLPKLPCSASASRSSFTASAAPPCDPASSAS
jgi:sugar lactone lactonase YvrE